MTLGTTPMTAATSNDSAALQNAEMMTSNAFLEVAERKLAAAGQSDDPSPLSPIAEEGIDLSADSEASPSQQTEMNNETSPKEDLPEIVVSSTSHESLPLEAAKKPETLLEEVEELDDEDDSHTAVSSPTAASGKPPVAEDDELTKTITPSTLSLQNANHEFNDEVKDEFDLVQPIQSVSFEQLSQLVEALKPFTVPNKWFGKDNTQEVKVANEAIAFIQQQFYGSNEEVLLSEQAKISSAYNGTPAPATSSLEQVLIHQYVPLLNKQQEFQKQIREAKESLESQKLLQDETKRQQDELENQLKSEQERLQQVAQQENERYLAHLTKASGFDQKLQLAREAKEREWLDETGNTQIHRQRKMQELDEKDKVLGRQLLDLVQAKHTFSLEVDELEKDKTHFNGEKEAQARHIDTVAQALQKQEETLRKAQEEFANANTDLTNSRAEFLEYQASQSRDIEKQAESIALERQGLDQEKAKLEQRESTLNQRESELTGREQEFNQISKLQVERENRLEKLQEYIDSKDYDVQRTKLEVQRSELKITTEKEKRKDHNRKEELRKDLEKIEALALKLKEREAQVEKREKEVEKREKGVLPQSESPSTSSLTSPVTSNDDVAERVHEHAAQAKQVNVTRQKDLFKGPNPNRVTATTQDFTAAQQGNGKKPAQTAIPKAKAF